MNGFYVLLSTIRFLILIGDITIFPGRVVVSVFKFLISLIISRVKAFYISFRRTYLETKKTLLGLSKNAGAFLHKSFTNFNKINVDLSRKSVKTKKVKRVKKIKIFPSSALWIKVRYFILGFIFSAMFIFVPLLILIFLQDLPNPKMLTLQDSAQTTKIYDRNGKLLYQIYANQNRTKVPLSFIPENLQKATIAIEDKDFYSNPGFDVEAIIRSALADLSGKPIQGGSTITQQLIKWELLSPEVNLTRKVKEIVLAFWAEKLYSKDQIFEMYLNEIPYGGTAWGIEAASQTYFGKNAKDLTLSESAFLAGLPNAPSVYSPYGNNPYLWKERQREVIRKMVEQKYITKKDGDDALKEHLNFKPRQEPLAAPHFVMFVKELLVKKYGLAMIERGGLSIKTSLDLNTQEMTEKVVKEQIDASFYLHVTNGASLVTNPRNGDILAMVGSKDYSDSNGGNYNVTTALRQPGSSIKVVTYSNALLKGFTAATTVEDAPITFRIDGGPSYSPVNYDSRFHGILTLRQALGNSINIPAVKLLNATGIPSMMDLGKKMGITTWKDPENYGLAITLGGADVKMLDMASVYGTLANGGVRVDINPILEVIDAKGNTLEKKKTKGINVMDPGVAFIISDILADNQARAMEFGTNSPLAIEDHTVSVKTGTSDNKRDNWTIGYTPSYVVTVWVGNNDNSPMDQRLASGITGAAPIWHNVMTSLLAETPKEKMPAPANIVQKSCFGRNEYFIKGTENFVNCTLRRISPTPQ